jgi:nucleoside-triphosphatase THEP1
MARAIVLTGERGSGKTTLCLALAAMSPRYVGLACPRIYSAAGHPVGFSARCLATAEEWVLGRCDTELDGPHYGRFSFSSTGIARAVDCLREILSASAPEEGDADAAETADRPLAGAPNVVVIDEIGPLELELDKGLAPVLPLLAAAGPLLLVVRPSLAARVRRFIPAHERTLLTLAPGNRSSLAARIDRLFG